MEAVATLDRVTQKYGAQTALADVSLRVPRGTVFALLGENGAGKTTALRTLLGLVAPDAGAARVLGLESLSAGLEIRRRVGYVPEQPALYDWMTVDEIGWFAAGFYPAGFQERYRDQVRRFGLPTDRKICGLSKGMRAKVSLALALGHDPDLLILDEPTSGLDTLVRREFLESMVDRAATGRSVLLSSHQINEVERVADEVAILHHGRVMLVERLDVLKAEIRQVTATLDRQASPPPAPEGELLAERHGPRQSQWLVRGMDDASLEAYRLHSAIRDLDVRVPSLEEIFVSYISDRPSLPNAVEGAEVVRS